MMANAGTKDDSRRIVAMCNVYVYTDFIDRPQVVDGLCESIWRRWQKEVHKQINDDGSISIWEIYEEFLCYQSNS